MLTRMGGPTPLALPPGRKASRETQVNYDYYIDYRNTRLIVPCLGPRKDLPIDKTAASEAAFYLLKRNPIRGFRIFYVSGDSAKFYSFRKLGARRSELCPP